MSMDDGRKKRYYKTRTLLVAVNYAQSEAWLVCAMKEECKISKYHCQLE